MLWEHIDFAPKVWTVTKTMKIDGHRVPLANAAVSVLRKMKSDDGRCDGRGAEQWIDAAGA